MSEKKYGGRPTCCMGCEDRKPGCHNVETCMAWAAEVARKRKQWDAREAARPVIKAHSERRRVI